MEAIREMIVEKDISAIEKAQATSGVEDSRLRDKRPDPKVAERMYKGDRISTPEASLWCRATGIHKGFRYRFGREIKSGKSARRKLF
ncbi:MAG: hypothetical protein SWK76_16285 [Actinomycetota bacterium]|nr:hypothetical protein [Actinomycetota bacterium]